ncbi:MAG: 30S ribosomal protein S6--L-glutamate ligase [Planctomycetes bacterium]|nr:30S ribosomal protein S6--L-glutamate ligase [Planctomycetota bacterium]
MKIAILSRAPHCYSTRRLREACVRRGHEVKVLDTLKFTLLVERKQPKLFFGNKRLSRYDAVVPRIGASITFYGTAVVRQFEQMGVFALNASQAISVSRDKLRSMQILSRHDIGIPPSAFVKDKRDVLPAIERVGGAPVIIKLLEGTQGVGVILADTLKIAQAIIETLQSARQNVLIQKFVSESKGRDIRAFVVGDHVVAAMRRIAQGQEFRSNVHRGGVAERVKLDAEYERTAIRAAQIMGLRVAGVDILEGKDGPQVLEVNSSPGLEGIESATGFDVAGAVVAHLEEQVLFPDVDIRERLTLGKGYGVAEIPVTKDCELARKTLAQAQLRERDILVLSITRGGLVIANPHGFREILVGDTLLCYGKVLALKALLPHARPRPRKRPKGRTAPAG